MKTRHLFLPIVMAFMIILCTSCIFDMKIITGKGNIITETRNATNFTSVDLQTGANIEIVKGSNFKVSVSDYENIVKYLSLAVENNCLIIKKEPNSVSLWNSKAKVVITMPDPLYSINLSGSGNIYVNSSFNDLNNLMVSGSGNIAILSNSQLNKLEARIAGNGNINAIGSVQDLTTNISGSGSVMFTELKARNATCSISGSGNTNVFIEDKLEASISGSGNIVYSGTPVVNSNLTGSGRVYKN